jgi:hypothetical protein
LKEKNTNLEKIRKQPIKKTKKYIIGRIAEVSDAFQHMFLRGMDKQFDITGGLARGRQGN